MHKILFATTNQLKVNGGNRACRPFGIELVPRALDIVEIQDADGQIITRDKAAKAFAITKEPTIVSDDTWIIPGLNGFPGPYMKDVSMWLAADNWLDLTRNLKDKRIILKQILVYQDETDQQLFTADFVGQFMDHQQGKYELGCMTVITFDEGQTSAAERIAKYGSFRLNNSGAWPALAEWYKEHKLHG